MASTRQSTFAYASAASAAAVAAVGYSMFALIPDSAVVLSNVAWSVATDTAKNTLYAGLGGVVVETAQGSRTVGEWGSGSCPSASLCDSCSEATSSSMPILVAAVIAMGATLCASALRAAARKDTAVLREAGISTGLAGVASLLFVLVRFNSGCHSAMPEGVVSASYGPGAYAVLIALALNAAVAAVHAFTPVLSCGQCPAMLMNKFVPAMPVQHAAGRRVVGRRWAAEEAVSTDADTEAPVVEAAIEEEKPKPKPKPKPKVVEVPAEFPQVVSEPVGEEMDLNLEDMFQMFEKASGEGKAQTDAAMYEDAGEWLRKGQAQPFARFDRYGRKSKEDPAPPQGWLASQPGAIAPVGFFDPWNLSKTSDERVKFFREAELKHGRVAMLAATGYLLAESFHPLFGGDIDGPSFDAFQATPLQNLWIPIVAALGLIETRAISTFKKPGFNIPKGTNLWQVKDDHEPGDLGFDPMSLKPTDPAKLRRRQEVELSNGRLAMLSIAGMVTQEYSEPGEKILDHANGLYRDLLNDIPIHKIAYDIAQMLNDTADVSA